jgi:hypothetical protein
MQDASTDGAERPAVLKISGLSKTYLMGEVTVEALR